MVEEIGRRDADLGRQSRRALSSAPLNMAEGMGNRGKTRQLRYDTALGSLREVLSCLEVGEAMGYVPPVGPALQARFDHVLGTLMNLVAKH